MAVMNIGQPLRGLRTERQSSVPRRRSLHRVGGAVVRQGVVGYAAALAVPWYLSSERFGLPREWTSGVVALVGVWLLYSFAALPAFERARSFKPSVRLVEVLGVATFGLVIVGVDNSLTARQAMVSVLAGPAVLGVSSIAHRQVLRRTPTILVGQVESVRRLQKRWAGRKDVNVVATCSWRSPHELAPAGAVADHSFDEVVREVLSAVAERHATSVVIASGRAFTNPALRHLAWALQRAEVECLVVADMSDHVEYLSPRRVGDQIALSLRAPNDHLMSLVVKSMVDRLTAAVALVVLSPVLLVVAVMIRLGSRGPAIFRQERSGRDGRPFVMYKFRTMVVDAEARLVDLRRQNEGAGPLFKLRNDPRITPLGRVLRRLSIDELPQLFNVVKGDMSLVGPRPALPAETSQYSEWVWRRLHVRPGLTGLWQVSGRSALSWEDSIRMDLQYVNNWNLRLDLAILARTVRAVLSRDGAH
ncbi:exopolysaccharide biosynthesis polyprenyl glycosylphosphotransferase [Aeromicrobium fastidiosum]|uniref:exopolysaccharide biosynthesis polyprenyl glycosylphosphotransferase n=1 Tax=Aeromicrobium fastidiosum TaxID=52699 RepID=UPI002023750E|nr:exopolysaccharide biosynthesis polyprenyl glycosylphosphotransferase [Aeromicrobium fastidiosum]MCL8253272.1 exopolysaccharide biosynthesis polyprenyl glycosylphosphotransferase [Aeromicrobium fastidiosum]